MKQDFSLVKDKVIGRLKKMTGYDFAELTPSGDSAVYDSIFIADRFYNTPAEKKRNIVLIPEEAGWLTYKKIPLELGLKIVEVKCVDGLIDLSDLTEKISDEVCCFIYVNPAGYFAHQHSSYIYNICKGRTLVIMDCSGSIGTDVCDGNFADIIIASFGKWKPVNLVYGGFIGVRDQKVFDCGTEIFAEEKFDNSRLEELDLKLDNLDDRYAFLQKHRRDILDDLSNFKIVHPDRKGINVIVRFDSEAEKKILVDYCQEKRYPYTICPRYIRLNKPAISIEVKRLE